MGGPGLSKGRLEGCPQAPRFSFLFQSPLTLNDPLRRTSCPRSQHFHRRKQLTTSVFHDRVSDPLETESSCNCDTCRDSASSASDSVHIPTIPSIPPKRSMMSAVTASDPQKVYAGRDSRDRGDPVAVERPDEPPPPPDPAAAGTGHHGGPSWRTP